MTKEKLSRAVYKSPVGELLIVCTETALLSLGVRKEQESAEDKENNPVVQQTIKELEEYFAGNRKVFTVPLDLRGTEFQKKVWEALREIPYGETRSYKEIAEKIGNPKASRAVGMANHRESHWDCGSLSSCGWRKWKTNRLCRRYSHETGPFGVGKTNVKAGGIIPRELKFHGHYKVFKNKKRPYDEAAGKSSGVTRVFIW